MVKTSLDIDLNATPTDHDTPPNVGVETVAEINKMRLENNKLREMLTLVWEGNFIKNHVNEPIQDPKFLRSNNLNKRKLKERDYERNTGETTEPITRVCRRVDSSDNTMVVKDGYKWRKYGQKVSKDNPSPRAYYKCTFPSCPAKKKVQGSVNDANLQVVVYEGEHIHQKVGILGNEEENLNSKLDQILVETVANSFETVANSLRRNPDFIQMLVEAISSKIMEYDLPNTLR